MLNADVEDLYERVKVGTKVVILPKANQCPGQRRQAQRADATLIQKAFSKRMARPCDARFSWRFASTQSRLRRV